MRDFCNLFRLKYEPKKWALIQDGDAFAFETFLAFIFRLRENVPLSISLKDKSRFYILPGSDKDEEKASQDAFAPPVMADVRPSNALVPLDETVYTPPGQLFSREWALIFSQLPSTRAVNQCALVCRFFRSVLFKYPPDNWRIAKVSSMEQRTADNIGSRLVQWQRFRTAVTLEVGVQHLGNMLNDSDLGEVIMNEMTNTPRVRKARNRGALPSPAVSRR